MLGTAAQGKQPQQQQLQQLQQLQQQPPPQGGQTEGPASSSVGSHAAERQPLRTGRPPEYLATSGTASSSFFGPPEAGNETSMSTTGGSSSTSTGGGANVQRRRSSLVNRNAFEDARQETWRSAMLNRETWRSPLSFILLLLIVLVVVAPPIFIIFVELKSLYVLFRYYGVECDQDLWFWLLVRVLLTWCSPRHPPSHQEDAERAVRQRFWARVAMFIFTVWLLIGYYWISVEKTCETEHSGLYSWVKFLVFFGILVPLIMALLPVALLLCGLAFHSLVAVGWLKSPEAASDDAIEHMQKVEYSTEVFTGGGSVANECCCCMEEFNAQKAIVCTPCGHHLHYDCLKEWLKVGKSCPLCRSNLDTPDSPA